jgi:hypothetical protein
VDSKTIGNIIAIVSPTITLILTILAVFNSRVEKNTTPLDTPSLKILTIKRQALSGEEWTKVTKNTKKLVFFYISLNLIVTIIILISSFNSDFNLNIYFLSSLIIMTASLTVVFYYTIKRYRIIIDARVEPFNLFHAVDIIIEADFHYLFDKCIDTLKGMNLKISEVELGDSVGKVKAVQISQLKLFAPWPTIRVTTITVQKIENSECSFTVTLTFFRKFKTQDTNVIETSRITNSFIDRLISKPTKV